MTYDDRGRPVNHHLPAYGGLFGADRDSLVHIIDNPFISGVGDSAARCFDVDFVGSYHRTQTCGDKSPPTHRPGRPDNLVYRHGRNHRQHIDSVGRLSTVSYTAEEARLMRLRTASAACRLSATRTAPARPHGTSLGRWLLRQPSDGKQPRLAHPLQHPPHIKHTDIRCRWRRDRRNPHGEPTPHR